MEIRHDPRFDAAFDELFLVQRDAQTWGGIAQRVTVATALAWYPVAAVAANA